jgi:hypothetical protein
MAPVGNARTAVGAGYGHYDLTELQDLRTGAQPPFGAVVAGDPNANANDASVASRHGSRGGAPPLGPIFSAPLIRLTHIISGEFQRSASWLVHGREIATWALEGTILPRREPQSGFMRRQSRSRACLATSISSVRNTIHHGAGWRAELSRRSFACSVATHGILYLATYTFSKSMTMPR